MAVSKDGLQYRFVIPGTGNRKRHAANGVRWLRLLKRRSNPAPFTRHVFDGTSPQARHRSSARCNR